MHIYLPIAQVSIDLFTLLGLGFVVGILSGMFGVGGGFIMTPILFLMGIPPNIAVASQSSQVVGTSTSGALVHFQRKTIDYKMGFILLVGGMFGSAFGVRVFKWVTQLGQIETFVTAVYVIFLSLIGGLMLYETINSMRKTPVRRKRNPHKPLHHWPLKMRFQASRMYISAIPPIMIGASVGFLAAIMGVGGGFILVPAMIYLIGMPVKTVIGTSMFQIIFVSAFTTIMHATTTHSVDIVLALILILGSIPGAQLGATFAHKLPAIQLRLGFALVILLIVAKLIYGLVVTPDDLYGLTL